MDDILEKMKRINIFTGHYGSGKTEVSVNMVIRARQRFGTAAIIDMDIANVYFRSRERQAFLEERGIAVYSNACGQDITADLPALSDSIRVPLADSRCHVTVDTGGNDAGAGILRQFRQYFPEDETAMHAVINAGRPETDTAVKAGRMIDEIEYVTGMKVNSIINNTHMLTKTVTDDIIGGYDMCRELSDARDIPLSGSCCVLSLIPSLEAAAAGLRGFRIIPVELYMRPEWLDA